jgi:hypothetical protein
LFVVDIGRHAFGLYTPEFHILVNGIIAEIDWKAFRVTRRALPGGPTGQQRIGVETLGSILRFTFVTREAGRRRDQRTSIVTTIAGTSGRSGFGRTLGSPQLHVLVDRVVAQIGWIALRGTC